jgi:peptidoglycan/LPS O-acetylase OafA/YrhL
MGSGFLITYLLYKEQSSTGKFDLKNFFIRRILRIWPAYYLLIIIALLVVLKTSFFRIPDVTDAYLSADYKTSNLLYLTFLPHVQPFLFPTAPYVHQCYTIGIEEQFYLVWGILFYYFRRYMVWILVFILIAMPLLGLVHDKLHVYLKTDTSAPLLLKYFNAGIVYLQYSKFSTFAIGSLFGYAYFKKKNWINIFKLIPVQLLVYTVLILSIAFNITVPVIHFEYMALLMACVMLLATFKKESIINFSAGWLEYLGKISYGIYLFHIFAIVLAIKLFTNMFKLQLTSFFELLLLAAMTMVISVLFGWLSYSFFEKKFLKLKKRFQKVPITNTSGNP